MESRSYGARHLAAGMFLALLLAGCGDAEPEPATDDGGGDVTPDPALETPAPATEVLAPPTGSE